MSGCQEVLTDNAKNIERQKINILPEFQKILINVNKI
jgi:hypothetical protein